MILLNRRIRAELSIRAPALAAKIGITIDAPPPHGYTSLNVPPPVAALIQARAAALGLPIGAYLAIREDMLTVEDAQHFGDEQLSLVTSADLYDRLAALAPPPRRKPTKRR